jgi:hypothetical protein
MVAVAVVGLLCRLEHRRREFASLAAYHGSKATVGAIMRLGGGIGTKVTYVDPDGNVMMMDDLGVASWHEALAEKYRHTARYPWLPVEPDPPGPE